ncbi:MAG TPA: OmpH family outer membrane protein [Ferruginibacter sp.]|nr:OmpH family outer membrane protein [Ferruginibacter sp.]
MKRKLFFLLTVCITLLFSRSHAQGKIGYVSADNVFAAMPDVLRADSALAAYQQALAESYRDQENMLNNAYAKFVNDSSKMTPAVKEAKRKSLQEQISGMSNKEQELNQVLEAEKERQLKPIREKMLKAIQDVAKENGYAHILYKEQAIVFPEQDDITEKVKKRLGIK